jgi:hypothetical protein
MRQKARLLVGPQQGVELRHPLGRTGAHDNHKALLARPLEQLG